MRSRAARLPLQRTLARLPTPRGRHALRGRAVAASVVALGLATRGGGGLALRRRRELDARAPRLRQSDRDRLFGRARAVLALADVIHLLAHELARLRRGGLSLAS